MLGVRGNVDGYKIGGESKYVGVCLSGIFRVFMIFFCIFYLFDRLYICWVLGFVDVGIGSFCS